MRVLDDVEGSRRGRLPARRSRAAVLALTTALCLSAFIVLGIVTRSNVPGVDSWLHRVAVQHRGGVTDLARLITEGGSTPAVWLMLVIAALVFPRTVGRRRWLVTAAFGAAAGTAFGARSAASDVLQRPRPPSADWAATAGGYGFPSGHTTAATVAAGALAWALARRLRGRRARAGVWVSAAGYAALVGWSRIWLGVHWPLDVAGGWLFGMGWLTGMSAALSSARGAYPVRRPPRADGPDRRR